MKGTPMQTLALKSLSTTFKKGELTALMGRTGSGKTTLSLMASGLILPDEGHVFVEGINTKDKKKSRTVSRKVGMVFQYPESQFFSATVEEEIAYGLKNYKIEGDHGALVGEALRRVGLDQTYAQRNPFKLSGGEQRLIAIASVIVWQPDYLIFDEPTAGLDAKGRKSVTNIIRDLQNEGKGIMIITHDIRLAKKTAQRLFVLSKGEMFFDGTCEAFFNDTTLQKQAGVFEPFER